MLPVWDETSIQPIVYNGSISGLAKSRGVASTKKKALCGCQKSTKRINEGVKLFFGINIDGRTNRNQ